MLAALESALGTDFGLSRCRASRRPATSASTSSGRRGLSVQLRRRRSTPGRRAADVLARPPVRPARVYAWHERDVDRRQSAPATCWWYRSPRQQRPTRFRRSTAGSAASTWSSCGASGTIRGPSFVGFKGGDNKANHSHLDLGTFVLDADWASAGPSTSAATTTTCPATSATSAGPTTGWARSATTRC